MSWINTSETAPPKQIIVEVRGTYYGGDWFDTAYRLDYKKGSTPSQLKRGWRWMKDGEYFKEQAVDAWRELPTGDSAQ